MKELSPKAIALGVVVDIVGSILLGLIGSMIMFARLSARGLSRDAIMAQLSTVGNNTLYTAFVVIVGFGMTAVGGYVAAWVARHNHLLNAAFVGGAAVVLGLFLDVGGPQWYRVMALLLPIPSAALGGYVYLRVRSL
ncbi:MAG: hypothetical protein GF418_12025 [Chitinivibrionales bacterium]|nr:hypothetical protein [Chitinivibrionales bacterium]MBD3396345.1 hypothetical protein [Chitinivibrionales bacterium]